MTRPRVAIIGAGISGLGCAWALREVADVSVLEREDRLGGHSHTVEVALADRRVPVDTGFIVYNERNYPNLTPLFAQLRVPTEDSNMSFAVTIDGGRLEYSGGELSGLFAQRRNVMRPTYWRMLADVMRFYRAASALADSGDPTLTLGEFLTRGGYGASFLYDHLLPMGAAIWSTPVDDMLAFPAMSFARFFKNHGLLSLSDRPRWRTVTGGSQVYVAKLAAASGARIATGVDVRQVRRDGASCTLTHGDGRSERFDHVVFACPADHALAMMADAGDGERAALGAFRFQPNRAHLHGDPALMPRRRRAWSSWNYIGTGPADRRRAVAVTYWMNRLQNLDPALPLFVTLNPPTPPRADLTHRVIDYRHPVFDSAAWAAQPKVEALQGAGGLWFAGAWLGYGFHEDGLRAGLRVALALGARLPWAHALTPAGGGSVARAA